MNSSTSEIDSTPSSPPPKGEEKGTPIRIISAQYTIQIKSTLCIAVSEYQTLILQWRLHPEPLGCELIFLKSVEKIKADVNNDNELCTRILLKFNAEFELIFEFETVETCNLMHLCLSKLLLEAQNQEKERESETAISTVQSLQLQSFRFAAFQVASKQEALYQLMQSLDTKEGCLLIDKLATKASSNLVRVAFGKWVQRVKVENTLKMTSDKARWRLHAACNQELDLQAWYHAVFFQEVYRLRGPFWYRDAVLPAYRDSYDLVDNALSPLEEAALAHVMCSPDTSYGDVAGQMFVVQALVAKTEIFLLFQRLASHGVQVTKYPRTGRPAKKTFRVSFVEGSIYLTWKGKFGNQGVDLGEVTSVIGGIHTDILRRAGTPTKADQYLSLVCSGRSVDLSFDSEDERNNWRDLLELLSMKEQGRLLGVDSVAPVITSETWEWLLHFTAIGRNAVPKEVVNRILSSHE